MSDEPLSPLEAAILRRFEGRPDAPAVHVVGGRVVLSAPVGVAEREWMAGAEEAIRVDRKRAARHRARQGQPRERGSPLSKGEYLDVIGELAVEARQDDPRWSWPKIARWLLQRDVDFADVRRVRYAAERWEKTRPK